MITATREYIELIATALTLEYNISLVPSSDGGWRTDVGKRIIYYYPPDLTSMPFDAARGYILHEVAHILHTQDEKVAETELSKKYGSKRMFGIYNMFEDPRIERRLISDYGMYAESAFYTSGVYGIGLLMESSNGGDITTLPRLDQLLLLSYSNYLRRTKSGIQKMMRYSRNESLPQMENDYNVAITEEVKKKYQENDDEIQQIFSDCEYRIRNTAEMIKEVNKRFIPIIQDWLEEDKDKQPIKTPVSCSAMASSSTAKGEGKQEAEGEGEKSDEEGKEGTKNSFRKISEPSRAFEEQMARLQDRFARWRKPPLKEAQLLLRPYINTLANRLADILKEKSATRFTGAHKSGKLLSVNTYKVLLNEKRIFSKKITPRQPQYNIYFGLDRSGSMGEDRIIPSYMAAVLIGEACKKMGFNVEYYSYHTTVKKLKSVEEYDGGGDINNEPALLRTIARDIEKAGRKYDDNIIFVITDGGTSRNDDFIDGEAHIKKVNATLYGIGIGDSSVEEMIKKVYLNGMYVQKVEELPFRMIEFMRTLIHR
jgi:hypothetical protein